MWGKVTVSESPVLVTSLFEFHYYNVNLIIMSILAAVVANYC